jgi:hypothetical protein
MKLVKKEDEEFMRIMLHRDTELLKSRLNRSRNHCAPEILGADISRLRAPKTLCKLSISFKKFGLLACGLTLQEISLLTLEHEDSEIDLMAESLKSGISVARIANVREANHTFRGGHSDLRGGT